MLTSQRWLDIVANNLANANTTGFKRDAVAFNDTFVQQLGNPTARGGVIGTLGAGMTMHADSSIQHRGPIHRTNNPLDVAINQDEGMFAVETPQGVRFTRDGSFRLDPERFLVTSAGHYVLDNRGQPIQMPVGGGEIMGNGEIVSQGRTVARLGVYVGEFRKWGANLYTGEEATALPGNQISLDPHSLEGSNVNAIESMVQMISIQRGFEMAQRAVLSEDEASQRLIQSLAR